MSVNQKTVQNLLNVEGVKRVVSVGEISPSDDIPHHVKDSHLMEVAAAPQELWEPLVKEAEENKWTVKETQAQVQQVNAVRTAPLEAQGPLRQIADAMSVSHMTVSRLLNVQEIKRVVPLETIVTSDTVRFTARPYARGDTLITSG